MESDKSQLPKIEDFAEITFANLQGGKKPDFGKQFQLGQDYTIIMDPYKKPNLTPIEVVQNMYLLLGEVTKRDENVYTNPTKSLRFFSAIVEAQLNLFLSPNKEDARNQAQLLNRLLSSQAYIPKGQEPKHRLLLQIKQEDSRERNSLVGQFIFSGFELAGIFPMARFVKIDKEGFGTVYQLAQLFPFEFNNENGYEWPELQITPETKTIYRLTLADPKLLSSPTQATIQNLIEIENGAQSESTVTLFSFSSKNETSFYWLESDESYKAPLITDDMVFWPSFQNPSSLDNDAKGSFADNANTTFSIEDFAPFEAESLLKKSTELNDFIEGNPYLKDSGMKFQQETSSPDSGRSRFVDVRTSPFRDDTSTSSPDMAEDTSRPTGETLLLYDESDESNQKEFLYDNSDASPRFFQEKTPEEEEEEKEKMKKRLQQAVIQIIPGTRNEQVDEIFDAFKRILERETPDRVAMPIGSNRLIFVRDNQLRFNVKYFIQPAASTFKNRGKQVYLKDFKDRPKLTIQTVQPERLRNTQIEFEPFAFVYKLDNQTLIGLEYINMVDNGIEAPAKSTANPDPLRLWLEYDKETNFVINVTKGGQTLFEQSITFPGQLDDSSVGFWTLVSPNVRMVLQVLAQNAQNQQYPMFRARLWGFRVSFPA